MTNLRVFLFGKFDVRHSEESLINLETRKVQELLCYLLLFRNRPHPREALADLLWGDTSTAQSKSYLRKALWQLQNALEVSAEYRQNGILLVDPDWVQLNPAANLWLDVAVLEQAFTLVKGIPGEELDNQTAQNLQSAVELYRGDLLEGWYSDWCLYERERLQYLYLALLDKLMDYCQSHQRYEAGIIYGLNALRYDQARERTHRRLMRLHNLAGDRTSALRQYERCVTALTEELGVKPTQRTVALYKQIWAEQSPALAPEQIGPAGLVSLPELLNQLQQFQMVIAEAQRQLQQNIEAIKMAIDGWR
jgi:DNA-binding SARP family transcriptional activator